MDNLDIYGQPYGGGEAWPKIRQAVENYARNLGQKIIQGGQEREALMNQAFDPNNPLKVVDERALARLTDLIMNAEMGIAPLGSTRNLTRSELQAEAKSLGLPATGKTEEIRKLVDIIKSDPKSWSPEDYKLVSPHLAIHQDFKPNSSERVESIMNQGLNSGMVDYLRNLNSGNWSFSKGLIGSDAYIFPTGSLKYKSASDPHLAPGNIPLFSISPQKGQDIYEAIVTTARRRTKD